MTKPTTGKTPKWVVTPTVITSTWTKWRHSCHDRPAAGHDWANKSWGQDAHYGSIHINGSLTLVSLQSNNFSISLLGYKPWGYNSSSHGNITWGSDTNSTSLPDLHLGEHCYKYRLSFHTTNVLHDPVISALKRNMKKSQGDPYYHQTLFCFGWITSLTSKL